MMKYVLTLLVCISSIAFASPKTNAFTQLLAQAELNNPRAQYQVSQAYRDGSGVQQSNQEAFYWLEQAAQNRYKPAQYDLVAQYLNGGLTKPSLDNALYWLTKLAISGDDKAQFELGQLYENHQLAIDAQSQAKLWYHVAAESNPAAEEAYATLLETQFNQQRAKQLAQMDELDNQLNENKTNPLSLGWNTSPSYPQLGFAALLVITVTGSATWLWRRKNHSSQQQTRREPIAITEQTTSENQQLKMQIAKQDRALKKQKRQLELLYQQLKKNQATLHSSNGNTIPSRRPITFACAMFGFEEDNIPETNKIKQRYKQLCKIYHPDLKGSDEEMKRLNQSLKIILDHTTTSG